MHLLRAIAGQHQSGEQRAVKRRAYLSLQVGIPEPAPTTCLEAVAIRRRSPKSASCLVHAFLRIRQPSSRRQHLEEVDLTDRVVRFCLGIVTSHAD